MKLYSHFRSSASYRVRIALALKGLAYETVPVRLSAGDQNAASYRAVNPQGLVPTLVDGDTVLVQSLAIMEYLEETVPEPALLPKSPADRAHVRALADIVACDIHPLNNLRVRGPALVEIGADDAQRQAWIEKWIGLGFAAFEAMVARDARTGRFCYGDTPGLADVCLVPQVFNARSFKVDLSPYPTLLRITDACVALPAFMAAAPERQPDAVAAA
jgi:maleylacetoacetate isomerase/maleylpyruvate isomerase